MPNVTIEVRQFLCPFAEGAGLPTIASWGLDPRPTANRYSRP